MSEPTVPPTSGHATPETQPAVTHDAASHHANEATPCASAPIASNAPEVVSAAPAALLAEAPACASSEPAATCASKAPTVACASTAPAVACASLEAPAPAVATAAAPAQAPVLGHAGSLTPLTDATAQDIEAALKSAQKARASQAIATAARPKGSDLIARKVVLRRDRWDSLLKLTNALQAQRGIVATPAEVAAIVLDAGLNVILEESAQVRSVARAAAEAPAPVEKRASAPEAAPAATVAARSFSAAELGQIRRLVRGLPSQRAVQRTLGLWLGANRGAASLGVPIEDLRSLCREFKVYDTANFAQNMKKDAAFFAEVRDSEGNRLGYDLTAKAVAIAATLKAAPAPARTTKKARAGARKPAKASAKRGRRA